MINPNIFHMLTDSERERIGRRWAIVLLIRKYIRSHANPLHRPDRQCNLTNAATYVRENSDLVRPGFKASDVASLLKTSNQKKMLARLTKISGHQFPREKK